MIKHKLIKMMVAVGLILATSVTTAFAATPGWAKLGNGFRYADSNGNYVKGWQQINGKWYYFSQGTAALKGYRPIGTNGVYYHFNDDYSWDGGRTYTAEEATRLEMQGTQSVNNSIAVGQQTSTNNQTQQSVANQTQTTTTEAQLSEEEFYDMVCKEMFKLVNEHREKNGVEKLEWSDELMNSAKLKSQHMVDNNYFGHSWNGMNAYQLNDYLSGVSNLGENILMRGMRTAATKEYAISNANSMFGQWKESAGHNANMLMPSYTKFGFGYKIDAKNHTYGTQHFQ